MLTRFMKMHGNGNDFVLLDNRDGSLPLDSRRVRALADRRFGIGCDQVLVAERPQSAHAPVAMRVFNADGGEAGQCGNGLRCFARFVRHLGVVTADDMAVETAGGVVRATLLGDDRVRASVGVPRFEPEDIPMAVSRRAPLYDLDLGEAAEGGPVRVSALSVGNPHAVLQVADEAAAPVSRIGPAIQALSVFPEGVNVGFMAVVDRRRIRLRVFERGVGETLACGSGACAAVVAGRLLGLLDEQVTVTLPGGELTVDWRGEGEEVVMEGPTAVAFTGEVEL